MERRPDIRIIDAPGVIASEFKPVEPGGGHTGPARKGGQDRGREGRAKVDIGEFRPLQTLGEPTLASKPRRAP
jgi:hypothetical protein